MASTGNFDKASFVAAMQYLLRCAMLFVGLKIGLWLVRPTSRSPDADTAASNTVSAAQAWHDYRKLSARGIVCQDDVGPHPGYLAAGLGLVAAAVLSAAMRRTPDADSPANFGQ